MDLKWTKSSSNCVSDLRSLATRRIFLSCLTFLCFYRQVVSRFRKHFLPQSNNTRSLKMSFQTVSSTINSYSYSFLVNGIFLWIKLPFHVLDETLAGNSFLQFKHALIIGYICNLCCCIAMCLYVVSLCYSCVCLYVDN